MRIKAVVEIAGLADLRVNHHAGGRVNFFHFVAMRKRAMSKS